MKQWLSSEFAHVQSRESALLTLSAQASLPIDHIPQAIKYVFQRRNKNLT